MLNLVLGFALGVVCMMGLGWYIVYSDDEDDFDCKEKGHA